MPPSQESKYAKAGVDQTRKDGILDEVLRLMRRTHDPGVIDLPWGFAGLYSLKTSSLFERNYRHPVLVSCADGVGTKVKIATALGKHDTVGIDCVAMCVNDLIVMGARPLFFLDYIGCGKVKKKTLLALMRGLIEGCRQSDCALLGGETAEMPGVYPPGGYDLAGFCVGIVEKDRIIDGSSVRPGDDVIGLASNGVHSNGYSLVRKIIGARGLKKRFGQGTVGEALLTPTKIYAAAVKTVLRRYRVKRAVRTIAHITGGGLVENIPRVLPKNCAVELHEGSWKVPPIFPWLQERGDVSREEMYRVFNMGLGLVMVTSPTHTKPILKTLIRAGEKAWITGKVVRGSGEVRMLRTS